MIFFYFIFIIKKNDVLFLIFNQEYTEKVNFDFSDINSGL
jgi:hypothetical protein